jgi:hypothetical protein
MGVMKTEPPPSDREVLAGLVERVTDQNAENGFCVIRVSTTHCGSICDHAICQSHGL